ncbi:MAG: SDR family oxidoreductase [Bacteroidota bacterium]
MELAQALAEQGWNLIITGRGAKALYEAQKLLAQKTKVDAIAGDVIDEVHLLQLEERIAQMGNLQLIINNASTLGQSPQPRLVDYPIEVLHTLFHTNLIAPLSLIQKLKGLLPKDGMIINLSSDAAIEAYPGWGGYGASKAGLDHLSAILAKEHPEWRVYWVDPGDMQTQMHQEAFPREDISDRPLPATRVPAFLQLIKGDLPSGRYRATALLPATTH